MLFHLEPYVILREKTSFYLKTMKMLPFSMVSSKKKKIVLFKKCINSHLQRSHPITSKFKIFYFEKYVKTPELFSYNSSDP